MGKLIESLEINSFRGIKELKVKDLGIINFFVGVNNCGKTSVLEALQLFEDCGMPVVDVRLMKERGFSLSTPDFSSLFFDCKTKTPIQIRAKGSNQVVYSLTIVKKGDAERNITFSRDGAENDTKHVIILNEGLEHTYCAKFSDGTDKKVVSNLFFYRQEGITSNSEEVENHPGVKICQSVKYVSPRSVDFKSSALREIIQAKREGELIKILQFVDPRIVDIMPTISKSKVSRPSAMVDIGGESRLPLEVLGDGVRRVLLLALDLLNAKNGFLLIDEIENGLHFATIVPVLQAILKAAIEQNVQLFITTHSLDVLRAIQKGFTDEDDVRVINLVQMKDRHKSYSYHYSEIDQLLKQEVEIR